jgi:hypothetical protein
MQGKYNHFNEQQPEGLVNTCNNVTKQNNSLVFFTNSGAIVSLLQGGKAGL